MNIEIDTSSLQKMEKHMGDRANRIVTAIDTIIKKTAMLVVRYTMKESPVRTGRLRASIGGGSYNAGPHGKPPAGSYGENAGVQFGRNFASVMPSVAYAKYVNRRNPFMQRGVEEAVPEIKTMVENEIKEAIK